MGRHLHIDPFAGIAGDMFLGACIDLGTSLEAIDAALRPLPIERPYRLTMKETHRQGLRGVDFKVIVGEMNADCGMRIAECDAAHAHDHGHGHSHDHGHHHSHSHDASGIPQFAIRPEAPGQSGTFRHIMALIDHLDAPPRAKERARAITTQIGRAESHVHGIPIDAVHFHEVGAVDSIVDMLGAAVALEMLDVETISSGPLPIGHGFVKCAHGMMPLPAPATAEILKAVPHHGVDRAGETVTPTGAAIVAALAGRFGPMPAMRVEKIGYGAGDRDTTDVPNLLRLFLGVQVSS